MRLKRLVFVAVLAMMVLGLVTVANAATFSDAGKYETQITGLNALEILNGYPDGTIKPDQPITRAEFAKMVVVELGLNGDIGASDTKFSDVTSDHWAGGLINVAVGQGLLKGYPDGTFQPDANVTYAEAITILVRALGYGPSIDESAWPAPYLAKAAAIGITDGVKVSSNSPAIRGDVFIMAFNALDAKVMKQTGWGTDIKYEESSAFEDTILNDKLDVDRVGDEDYPVRVTGTRLTDGSMDVDKFKFDDSKLVKGEPVYDGDTLKMVGGLNPNDYLGKEVQIWKNSDGDAIYIKVETNTSNIITDTVNEVNGSAGAYKFKMLKSGNTYNLASDAKIYRIGFKASGSQQVGVEVGDDDLSADTVAGNVIRGRSVTAVLNSSGDIAWAICYSGDPVIISEVNASAEKIKYYYDSDTEKTLDLSDNDDYVVYRDGVKVSLSDLQPDDILNVYPDGPAGGIDPDNVVYLKAQSAKVTGTVSEVNSASSYYQDYSLVIDDKTYALAGNMEENTSKGYGYSAKAVVTISFDNNETIEEIDSDDPDDDLADLEGQEVTLYLYNGSVRHIVAGNKPSSNDIYAIAQNADYRDFEDDMKIKVVNGGGDTVTYYGTDKTKYTATPGGTEVKFDDLTTVQKQALETNLNPTSNGGKYYLAKITLKSDGTLDTFESLLDVAATGASALKADQNDRSLQIGSSWIDLREDAVFFDAIDPTDADDLSWTNIQDTSDRGAMEGFVYHKDGKANNDIQVVVITSATGGTASSDDYYGFVMSKTSITDAYKLKVYVNGEEKIYNTEDTSVASKTYSGGNEGTYVTSSAKMSNINVGDAIKFTLNSAGEIDSIEELIPGDNISYKVTDVSAKTNTVKLVPLAGGTEVSVKLSTERAAEDLSYLIDKSGTAAKTMTLADLSEDNVIQIFYFDSATCADNNQGRVQLIKMIKTKP